MQEIIFEFDTKYGLYRDALYFPDDQPLPPQAVIEAMKLERVNRWVAYIESQEQPQPEPELTDG